MPTMQTGSRISFRRILFPTDFSSASEAALPFAVATARSYGAKIYALHVFTPAAYTYRRRKSRLLQLKRARTTRRPKCSVLKLSWWDCQKKPSLCKESVCGSAPHK